MRRFGLFWLVGLLGVLCSGAAFGQQFRISGYDGENVTIEYPPSFDGAYLFIEKSTNLVSGEWETVDYSQVTLVEGEQVLYSPPATSSGDSTNIVEIPYVMSVEYIQAVSNGEITNSAWTANASTPLPPEEGDHASYRIEAISYVDTDGDGIDNVTEYGAGTDPNVSDAPPANLPLDDGDPQPVPGSVDSALGDWNTPLQVVYRTPLVLHEAINARILAMDGTNGTFTAQTPVATLGAWVEAQCGTWVAVAGDDFYPTVSGGRFYRNPEDGFSWTGKEHVYPLALNAYDGSEAFINHLIQVSSSDPAGLAILPDGSPVLVDASHPWTEEKVTACLEQMRTVACRVQQLSGDVFDPADTTAMAQAQTTMNGASLTPDNRLWQPNNIIKSDWEYDWYWYEWIFQSSSYAFTRNQYFTFLDGLQAYGFGPSTHRGYVGVMAEYAWEPYGGGYKRSSWQSTMPPGTLSDLMTETFFCSDNESAWFMGGSTNYCDVQFREIGQPNMVGGRNYFLTHQTGFQTYEYTVLSTLSPPIAPPSTLIMDCDRDGTIGSNDWSRIDESHPFRFWVNEDGNAAVYPEADLEDFFPVQIMWLENTPNLTFKLSANVDLDYIPTSMTTNNSDAYLTELSVAGDLSQPGQIKSLTSGSQTSEAFAENSIVLLAASGVNTNAEIYVHILENGTETAVATNYFSFSSISNMYRTMSFRETGTSYLDEPANWPDELTNGKNLVYVHGFNVDESAAENWHRNIFKRLWHSGSNAKYHGVIWDGIGTGSIMTHFHNSVVNAFATAPWLAEYLKSPAISATETVVLGHSLGNMVVSSAICEHDAPVTQYYALDAAVALEAYGDVTTDAAFVPDVVFTWEKIGFLNYKRQGWLDYPFETWAAEWYRLFPESDPRSRLTFRHKFADIQEKTDVFNFYSSTEDVLRVRDDVNQILQSITDVDIEMFMHIIPTDLNIESQCAWQLQEMYKGMDNWAVKYGGGGSSKYTGWAFTEYDGVHQIDRMVKDIGSHPPTYTYTKYSESGHAAATALSTNATNETVRNAYLENLKTDPLFNRTPWQLFDAGAATFAGGIVGDYEGVLNYDNSELIGAPDIDVSQVKVSDWLLAKGFPSRTGPMGSAEHKKWDEGLSIDMFTDFRTDPNEWPIEDSDDNKIWRHSDWKNAPYVHVYKLFDKITGKEN